MIERFYSIDHLTTKQLVELYTSYAHHGWTDTEFYRWVPKQIKRPVLSFDETRLNIDSNNEHNYFMLMIGCEEEDGIIIGLGMSGYPDFAIYLHLPERLCDKLVFKYKLNSYTTEEFLVEQTKNNLLN